jgi:hypothetical protein
MWAIWYARRKIIHDGEYQSLLSTHLFIENYLRELSIVSSGKATELQVAKPKHPRWLPPKHGCVKLNVDAAVAKNKPDGAVEVVCRSESGVFLGASSISIPGISDPFVLEALACREALALALDLQLRSITVAMDCLAVVSDMSRPYAECYSSVLQEIKETSSDFD